MNHYILTAAGEGVRWNNYLGYRKHMVPINGEPNIIRTIRMIRENDKNANIFVGIHPSYPINSNEFISYDGTTYYKGTESDRYFASVPQWNQNGRTTLIWGDVFFTKDAIRKICNFSTDWLRFARPNGNIFKSYGEEFALSFYPEHHSKVNKACGIVENISLQTGIQLYGAIYLAMLEIPNDKIIQISGSGTKPNLGNQIDINDETDDFDFPGEYDKFIKTWKGD